MRDAQPRHHADAKDHRVLAVALVGVDAAGQRRHAPPAHRADDELAGVADHGGRRPVRDVPIRDVHRVGQRVGEVAEARPQDHGDARRLAAAAR